MPPFEKAGGSCPPLEVVEKIGEGRHGTVYLTICNNKPLVIKFTKKSEEIWDDLLILQQLDQGVLDPYIATLSRGNQQSEVLVTNFINGLTLRELVESDQLLPKHLSVLNMLISHISQQLKVYRDLSPDNLIFSQELLEWIVVDAKIPIEVTTFSQAVTGNAKSIYSKLTHPSFGWIKTGFLQLLGHGKYRINRVSSNLYRYFFEQIKSKQGGSMPPWNPPQGGMLPP